jgi:hypothetical protein
MRSLISLPACQALPPGSAKCKQLNVTVQAAGIGHGQAPIMAEVSETQGHHCKTVAWVRINKKSAFFRVNPCPIQGWTEQLQLNKENDYGSNYQWC